MTTVNEIKKRINYEKLQLIHDMDEADLKNYILNISQDYYIYYINNDAANFNAVSSILEYIKTYDKYDGLNNYMNYCMVIAINSLLNKLMNNKLNLMMPEMEDINNDYKSTVSRLDIVKAKRQELYDLRKSHETIYDKVDKELELTEKNSYMNPSNHLKYIIRKDISAAAINDNISSLETILTPEAIVSLKEININEGGNTYEDI